MLVPAPGRTAGKRLMMTRPTLNDYRSIFWSLEMPICKHSVRKLRSVVKFLKRLSEKFLTFVNPVLPARVEHMLRLPAWRFAEARTENNTDPTHPASRVRLFGTIYEVPGFSCRALSALPIGGHRALGRGARLPALPLRFLQPHVQCPDEDTPCEIAQQGTLVDIRGNDGRAKEHPQERGGVRSERGDLVALAQALPRVLHRAAREDNKGGRGRLLECLGAHRGLGERERGRPCMGEGAAPGRSVLVGLRAAACMTKRLKMPDQLVVSEIFEMELRARSPSCQFVKVR